jgi:GT2 family glycosyltransferase
MRPAPRWSVVIPTFRRHAMLEACLERLAPGRQSLDTDAYEVVVSDDAASSLTRAFLERSFPWALWVAGPGRGPAANRNAGASAARGAWLAFTDDDTLPTREWLAAFDRAAAMTPGAEALEGRTTCPGGFGTPMYYAPVNESGGRFWSCNIAVRADRFRSVGGFDEGFLVPHMEDQDLRERLNAASVTIHWVPDAHVEHPPRRQPSGRRLGMLRAAEVRYLCKHGAESPVRWRLLGSVVRLRVGIIASLPWSADSFEALRSLASEAWTVLVHSPEWERAARLEFPVRHDLMDPAIRVELVDLPRALLPANPLRRPDGSASVTVIVPSWRRPDELTRCLRALAAQTRVPDELIVVTRDGDDPTREAARRVPFPAGCERVLPRVREGGVVAALQVGVEAARGAIIAFTDDDAEPRPDWIERLVGTLEADRELAGVGGRDWQPTERGTAPVVGRVRWFGRVIGRHHLGGSPAREVDVLKGVNCAFRAALVRAVGIDGSLRGAGAQVHWELALCLPMRRAGWRLRYDPALAVDHHVAPREGEDQVHRGRFSAGPFGDAVFNEARALSRHLGPIRWAIFTAWAECVGTSAAPGVFAAIRLRIQGHRWAWEAWRAAVRARRAVRRDRRLIGRPPRWVPAPGSLA